MSIRVHVGGQILLPEDARISVFDRGFLYGDSVFETLATAAGRLFALHEHLDRLERSAALVGITAPPRVQMEAAVTSTVAAAGNPESRVRIIISRGEGGSDLDPGSAVGPNLVVIVTPRGGPTAQMYVEGVRVAIVSYRRNDPHTLDPTVKSGNYLTSVLAVGEARRAGAHEAILCAQDGGVAEGATSNLFVVRAGVVRTPAVAVGILPGITRAHVLSLCRRNEWAVEETAFLAADDLHRADEVFLTSSVRGVLPVTSVDGRKVAQGEPGPITRRLMHAYERLTLGGTT